MVSDNSDIGSGRLYANKGEVPQQTVQQQSYARPSNHLIFIGFIVSILFSFSGVVTLLVAPGLVSVQVVFLANVVLFAITISTGFALYQRSNQSIPKMDAVANPGSPVGEMQAQLEAIQQEQKNLRRAYREQEIRADAANKSKAAFLAHLSHDIRTPLNHIIGFADLVGHEAFGPLGDKRYLSYVNDIKKSGEGLLNSVAGVLELAELESGQRVMSCEKIVVNDLLRGLKTRFDDRAKRCSVSLEIECFCATVLHGDRMSYERLLGNLLDNSFRFTPAGGKIRLAAWVADDGVVLEVSDNGIGIPPQRLAELAQPFFHGDGENTKEHGGMGLGLAIARSVAQLSGGELAIDSRPSFGTTVAISLPINAHLDTKSTKAA